jgi:hypothetical protein
MEENRIPKRVLYMNFDTTRVRGGSRNRWKNEVKEGGRIVVGEGWQGKVYNRQEWKKLLGTALNHRILRCVVSEVGSIFELHVWFLLQVHFTFIYQN